jgi:hypothetical protein
MKMKINGAANTDDEPSDAIPRIRKQPSTRFAITLSRELVAAAIRLAGKSENTAMLDASGGDSHCRSHLLVDERLQTAKDTDESIQAAYYHKQNKNVAAVAK